LQAYKERAQYLLECLPDVFQEQPELDLGAHLGRDGQGARACPSDVRVDDQLSKEERLAANPEGSDDRFPALARPNTGSPIRNHHVSFSPTLARAKSTWSQSSETPSASCGKIWLEQVRLTLSVAAFMLSTDSLVPAGP
jgi:hypothetical protein